MKTLRIVVLANSRKHAGRCLAGRQIIDGKSVGWIRPVSDRPGEEVSEEERRYQNGTDPKVFDVVDVPAICAKPHACQTENWLISPEYYWVKKGEVTWNQALELAENPKDLWVNGDSTYNGQNDQMSQAVFKNLTTSICMIYVPSVQIHILDPGAAFGNSKRRVQARFSFNGTPYWIWVTDPLIERRFLASEVTTAALGECLITVSLAEPHEKSPGVFYQYKLAAAIMERP